MNMPLLALYREPHFISGVNDNIIYYYYYYTYFIHFTYVMVVICIKLLWLCTIQNSPTCLSTFHMPTLWELWLATIYNIRHGERRLNQSDSNRGWDLGGTIQEWMSENVRYCKPRESPHFCNNYSMINADKFIYIAI